VRQEWGYPIMVTPLSQFVGTQAAINVIVGERYRQVSDQTILDQNDSIKRRRELVSYGDTGWETARAVHWCNASMIPAGKSPRWQHIPTLRSL
jgi:hypothetical protein